MARIRLKTLLAIALCCPFMGCLSFYRTRPMDVIVTRTDTGKPAAGVPVKVSYGNNLVLNQPWNAEGKTNSTGQVTLPIADFKDNDGGMSLEVNGISFDINAKIVNTGGKLHAGPPFEAARQNHFVELVPRPQTFIQRLLGYWETTPADESSADGR